MKKIVCVMFLLALTFQIFAANPIFFVALGIGHYRLFSKEGIALEFKITEEEGICELTGEKLLGTFRLEQFDEYEGWNLYNFKPIVITFKHDTVYFLGINKVKEIPLEVSNKAIIIGAINPRLLGRHWELINKSTGKVVARCSGNEYANTNYIDFLSVPEGIYNIQFIVGNKIQNKVSDDWAEPVDFSIKAGEVYYLQPDTNSYYNQFKKLQVINFN